MKTSWKADQVPMKEVIGKRRWLWIGHTLRKPKVYIFCLLFGNFFWKNKEIKDKKRGLSPPCPLLLCGLCSDPGRVGDYFNFVI